jgi:hypothetical protein
MVTPTMFPQDKKWWRRKSLDWGGKGGKGGAMRGYQKWFCTTPYFLVIANDLKKDEKPSQKLSLLFLLS